MPPVTADNRGPLVNVGIWITLVAMGFSAWIKLYTKYYSTRRLQMDDFTVLGAVLLAVGVVISTSQVVSNGLGRHRDAVSDDEFAAFERAIYATDLIYIPTIFVSKMACLHYFINLTYVKKRKLVLKGVIVFIYVWTAAAFFISAFRCGVPRPWMTENAVCLNMPAFWTVNAITDMITQVSITLFPIWLLHDLQTTLHKKRLAMLWFAPASFTVPIAIIRLVYIFSLQRSTDVTWDSFNYSLVTGLHACLAVIMVCLPFSKVMVDSLAVGVISNDMRGVLIGAGRTGASSSDNKDAGLSQASRRQSRLSRRYPGVDWNYQGANTRSAVISAKPVTEDEEELQGLRETGSSTDRMVIHYSKSTTVSSELRNGNSLDEHDDGALPHAK